MSEACCRGGLHGRPQGSRDFRKASAERRLGTGGDKPRPYGMAGSVFVGADAHIRPQPADSRPGTPNAPHPRAGINPAPTKNPGGVFVGADAHIRPQPADSRPGTPNAPHPRAGINPAPTKNPGGVFVGAAFMAARRAAAISARLPPNAAWARAGINPAPTAWPEACS